MLRLYCKSITLGCVFFTNLQYPRLPAGVPQLHTSLYSSLGLVLRRAAAAGCSVWGTAARVWTEHSLHSPT